jgi:hypothetical protein
LVTVTAAPAAAVVPTTRAPIITSGANVVVTMMVALVPIAAAIITL